jgi:antirestriction protein ArdC
MTKTSTRKTSRKPMTEAARQEAAEARTAKLDALHEDLAAQVETLTSSEGWTAMLRAAAAFRTYSMRNVLLLALQMDRRGMDPGSRVAGFTTWKTLGRSVIKGEKGLAILAPCTYRKTTEASSSKETSTDTTATEQPDEAALAGKGRKVLRGFKIAYVFAQEQTEGEDLPALLTPPMLKGEAPDGLWDGLAAQVEAVGYTLQRGDCGSAEGYTDPKAKTVRIRDGLDDGHACSVLTHELAHALMHCADGYDYAGHRGTAEIEAESVAFLVTSAAGLPSGSCAAPYVAGWAGGDVTKVKAAAERVVRTAHSILDRLDGSTGQVDTDQQDEGAQQAAA